MANETLFSQAAKALTGVSAPWHVAEQVAVRFGIHDPAPAIVLVYGETADTGSRHQRLLGTCFGLAPGLVVFEPFVRLAEDGRNIFCGLLEGAPHRPHLFRLRTFEPIGKASLTLSRTAWRRDQHISALRRAGYAHEISFRDGEKSWGTFGLPEAVWTALEAHIFPLLKDRSPLSPLTEAERERLPSQPSS